MRTPQTVSVVLNGWDLLAFRANRSPRFTFHLVQRKGRQEFGLFFANHPQPCLDPPKSKWHDWPEADDLDEEIYQGKCSLLNDVTRLRSCSFVPRCYVNRIRLQPLRRDDHSRVLIGAGGTQRSDWPARVLAYDVSTRIDRQPVREERSIARVQRQLGRRNKPSAEPGYLSIIFFLPS